MMESSPYFYDFAAYTCFEPEGYGKSTLFENEHILVGLNCLTPGQTMEKHAHDVQCRFYAVLEGSGLVRVGEEEQIAAKGKIIWVPAGRSHCLKNTGSEPWVLLVGIAPAHAH